MLLFYFTGTEVETAQGWFLYTWRRVEWVHRTVHLIKNQKKLDSEYYSFPNLSLHRSYSETEKVLCCEEIFRDYWQFVWLTTVYHNLCTDLHQELTYIASCTWTSKCMLVARIDCFCEHHMELNVLEWLEYYNECIQAAKSFIKVSDLYVCMLIQTHT